MLNEFEVESIQKVAPKPTEHRQTSIECIRLLFELKELVLSEFEIESTPKVVSLLSIGKLVLSVYGWCLSANGAQNTPKEKVNLNLSCLEFIYTSISNLNHNLTNKIKNLSFKNTTHNQPKNQPPFKLFKLNIIFIK